MNKLRVKSIKKAVINILAVVVIMALAVTPLITGLFLQDTQTAFGDAAPVFLGGVNIRPYSENNITLKKEDLAIQFVPGKQAKNNVYGDETLAHVSATFIFVNTGKEVSLKMGFPFGLAKMRGFNTPNVQNVSVEINGKKITPHFLTAENGRYDPWIYFNAEFKKNETKTLKVTYDALPVGGYFLYVLKTGAMWKGPIGELNIDLKFPYSAAYPDVLSVTPNGYTVKGNDIVYHLKNYEPDENITVKFLPYDFANEIAPLREKAEKTNKPEDWYTYIKKLLPDDIVGPYKTVHNSFIRLHKTNGYEDFVRSELQKGIEACKGTEYGKILEIAKAAHFAKKDAFPGGVLYLEINQLADIEKLFGTELKNPRTKEMGRVVAYYYWWKANALGASRKYEGFDALAEFLKLAPEYIPFDECEKINSVEIVQYTPYPLDSAPLFEEFVYPEKVVAVSKQDRIVSIQIDFKNPFQGFTMQNKVFQHTLKEEAKYISLNIDGIKFDFTNPDKITATYAVPYGIASTLEKSLDKIPHILRTGESPFYVYPKALLKKLEIRQYSPWNIKPIKNDVLWKLNRAEAEIKQNTTGYWIKMKNTPEGINTYKGAISIPILYIENNKYFIEKVPDTVQITVEPARAGGPAPSEKNTERVITYLAIISAVIFAIIYVKEKKS